MEVHIKIVEDKNRIKFIHWGYTEKANDDKLLWQDPTKLEDIDQYFDRSLIQFNTREGEKLWGLVDSKGVVTIWGRADMFTYSINRLFLNYWLHQWTAKFTIIRAKIKWEGEEKLIGDLDFDQDSWLLPIWLPKEQWSFTTWKVVQIEGGMTAVVNVRDNPAGIMIFEIVYKVNGRQVTKMYKAKVERYYIFLAEGIRDPKTGKWSFPDLKRNYPLADFQRLLGLSIVHWTHPQSSTQSWGLINSHGEIVGFANNNHRFQETMCRLFLQQRMKVTVIDKNYELMWYKIKWQGKYLPTIYEVNVDMLLRPTWLENQLTHWKVVKHFNKLVMMYIGDVVETVYGDDITEKIPKLPIVAEADQIGGSCVSDYYGKCLEDSAYYPIDDKNSCSCASQCQCKNPYHIYRNADLTKLHPRLPFQGMAEVNFINRKIKGDKFTPPVVKPISLPQPIPLH